MALLTNLQKRVAGSRQERGAVLVLTALVMMLLLFIAAFATDLGAWYRQGQEQQRAADVGSLNGVQAYDRAVKEYFDLLGKQTWSELSLSEQLIAEEKGMVEAVNTIVGLIESTGLSFSSPPTRTISSTDPTNPADTSVWTVTADDGTQVVITRSFVQNGTNAATGQPTYSRSIAVEIRAPGEQYFSNLLRDAPEIDRDATALISNCNAVCDFDIPLEPPFAGFAAAGNGDGFRPLPTDDGRVFLVNHLYNGGYGGVSANVVCMDVREQGICPNWAPIPRQLHAANRPADVIDNSRNMIFYPGMSQDETKFQIGCVRTDTPIDCASTTISETSVNSRYYRWGGGPWMINDNLWAVSGTGTMFCIDPDKIGAADPFCPGYSSGKSSAATGNVTYGAYVAGEVIDTKIFMYHPSDRIWHCFDTATDAACSAALDGTFWTSDGMKFIRYNTAGAPIGVCFAMESITVATEFMSHECLGTDGQLRRNPIPNLNVSAPNDFDWDNGGQWGEGYTWVEDGVGKRMYTSFWPSYRINCYDWANQSPCDPIDAEAFDGGHIDFYTFAALNDDCLMALGDVSKFYTFSPQTGEVCTGSTVRATITPCICTDGSSRRYGTLRLPDEIEDVLNSADAEVYDAAGNLLLTVPDLLAGPIDLSIIDGNIHNSIDLVINVDSKVDANDIPLWKEPFNASLSLVVQPTLTD